jgi:putative oxidoreductase
VQRLFCAFPAGRPGAGLLLLRSGVGLAALAEGAASLAGGNQSIGTVLGVAAGALAVAGGVLLLLGFLTPIAASVLVLSAAVHPSDDGRASVFVVIVSVALVLLGPGAFSVDSRLFGRRQVVIPRRQTGTLGTQ